MLTQEEDARNVQVRGSEVRIQAARLEENSGSAKVTLWKDASNADIRPGDYVTITDVLVNTFRNETSLSTTRTTVRKSEAPLEDRKVVVIGICVEEGKAELLIDNDDIVTMPVEYIMQAMPGETLDVEQLTPEGPVCLDITSRNSDVISFAVATCRSVE